MLKKGIFSSLVFFIFFIFPGEVFSTSSLEKLRSYAHQKRWQKAIAESKKILRKKRNHSERQLIRFSLGYFYHQLGMYKEAERAFLKVSLKEIKDYKNFFLSEGYFKRGKHVSFKKRYKKIKRRNLHDHYLNRLDYYRALILKKKKKFKRSYSKLFSLQKKSKRLRHKIWEHLLELKLKMKKSPCHWVYKIYKYQPHSKLLQYKANQISYRGKKISCQIPHKWYTEKRIRNLFFLGYPKEAKKEALKLRKEDSYEGDMLLSKIYMWEGKSGKALQIAKKHLRSKKNSYDHFKNLAKINAGMGNFHLSTRNYKQAHYWADTFKEKYKSYFLIGFSYFQGGKYSKAIHYMKNFIKKFPIPSRYVGSAYWYIFLSYYLNNNNKKAKETLNYVLNLSERDKRGWSNVSDKKLMYWLAMVNLKDGRNKEAEKIFKSLADDHFTHYYSVLSYLKLKSLGKADFKVQFHKLKKGLKELTVSTPFPQFKVADRFLKVGLRKLARHELRRLQKKKRKRKFLSALMKKYYQEGFYYDSLYIEKVFFSEKRKKSSPEDVASLWLVAYPQAYQSYVSKISKKLGIKKEVIWSLIKGESLFREEATSRVNARGLMQIMYYTAEKVAQEENFDFPNVESLYNSEKNILIGSTYVKKLFDQFQGNYPYIFGAYNAGPHRVSVWGSNKGNFFVDEFVESIPFLETRNYVKKIYRYFVVYSLMNQRPKILASSGLNWSVKLKSLSDMRIPASKD